MPETDRLCSMADGRAIRRAMRLHLRSHDPDGGALLKRQNRAVQRALNANSREERTEYVQPVQVVRVLQLPQRPAPPAAPLGGVVLE